MTDLILPADLEDGTRIAVAVDPVGQAMVSSPDIVGGLSRVTASVERVSREMLEAVKSAAPDSATVEIGFTLGLEQGQLVALFGKAKGEASVTVTLEWTRGS